MFGWTMIGAVTAAAGYAYVQGAQSEVEYVRSSVDQRSYLVQKGGTASRAADALGKISMDIEALIRHMQKKFPDDARVVRMAARFNPSAVSEGTSKSGYTSYSVNKGESVVLCLRQPDDSFADPNVVMYVALHELGHLATKEIGHPPPFWDAFRFILREAVAIGIYTKTDYAKDPKPFCGITVDSSVI